MALRPSHAMETLCSLARPWSSRYSAVSRLTVTRLFGGHSTLPHPVALRGTVRVAATLVNTRFASASSPKPGYTLVTGTMRR